MAFDIESIADRFLEVIANASRRRPDMPGDGAGGSAVMTKKARSDRSGLPARRHCRPRLPRC